MNSEEAEPSGSKQYPFRSKMKSVNEVNPLQCHHHSFSDTNFQAYLDSVCSELLDALNKRLTRFGSIVTAVHSLSNSPGTTPRSKSTYSKETDKFHGCIGSLKKALEYISQLIFRIDDIICNLREKLFIPILDLEMSEKEFEDLYSQSVFQVLFYIYDFAEKMLRRISNVISCILPDDKDLLESQSNLETITEEDSEFAEDTDSMDLSLHDMASKLGQQSDVHSELAFMQATKLVDTILQKLNSESTKDSNTCAHSSAKKEIENAYDKLDKDFEPEITADFDKTNLQLPKFQSARSFTITGERPFSLRSSSDRLSRRRLSEPQATQEKDFEFIALHNYALQMVDNILQSLRGLKLKPDNKYSGSIKEAETSDDEENHKESDSCSPATTKTSETTGADPKDIRMNDETNRLGFFSIDSDDDDDGITEEKAQNTTSKTDTNIQSWKDTRRNTVNYGIKIDDFVIPSNSENSISECDETNNESLFPTTAELMPSEEVEVNTSDDENINVESASCSTTITSGEDSKEINGMMDKKTRLKFSPTEIHYSDNADDVTERAQGTIFKTDTNIQSRKDTRRNTVDYIKFDGLVIPPNYGIFLSESEETTSENTSPTTEESMSSKEAEERISDDEKSSNQSDSCSTITKTSEATGTHSRENYGMNNKVTRLKFAPTEIHYYDNAEEGTQSTIFKTDTNIQSWKDTRRKTVNYGTDLVLPYDSGTSINESEETNTENTSLTTEKSMSSEEVESLLCPIQKSLVHQHVRFQDTETKKNANNVDFCVKNRCYYFSDITKNWYTKQLLSSDIQEWSHICKNPEMQQVDQDALQPDAIEVREVVNGEVRIYTDNRSSKGESSQSTHSLSQDAEDVDAKTNSPMNDIVPRRNTTKSNLKKFNFDDVTKTIKVPVQSMQNLSTHKSNGASSRSTVSFSGKQTVFTENPNKETTESPCSTSKTKSQMFQDNLKRDKYKIGPSLVLKLARHNCLKEAYQTLTCCSKLPLGCYEKIDVHFKDRNGQLLEVEEFHDLFCYLAQMLFSSSNLQLFEFAQSEVLYLNPYSEADSEMFQLAGIILGLAIIHNQQLGIPLSLCFFKCLLNRPFTYEDVREIDAVLYQKLKWLKYNRLSQSNLYLTFTTTDQSQNKTYVKELVCNGQQVQVTDCNKVGYIELATTWILASRSYQQMDDLRRGFESVMDPCQLTFFETEEIQQLISTKDDHCNCSFPDKEDEDRNNTM